MSVCIEMSMKFAACERSGNNVYVKAEMNDSIEHWLSAVVVDV